MLFSSTHHSRIYRRFMAIEPNAYREIIRFYEAQEEAILHLDADECFELMALYANALFEVGNYRAYLQVVDMAIEASIQQNIVTFQGTNIFRLLLFRKAAAFFHTGQLGQAEYILKELIKMDRHDALSVTFLRKCYRERLKKNMRIFRALAVFFILVALMVSGIEVLFVRPFYAGFAQQIQATRWLFLGLGSLSILSGITWQYGSAFWKAMKAVKS